jgi:hypothetical protein
MNGFVLLAIAAAAFSVSYAEQIRMCSCDEQQRAMNKMEQMMNEAQQKYMQEAQQDMKKMGQEQQMKDCFNQYMHSMHDMMKCTYKRMADKNSCTKDKSDKQMMEKENSNQKMGEMMKRMSETMRQQMEQTMQKAGGKQQNAFARVFTDMTQRMPEYCAQMAQKTDAAQMMGCEMKMDEQMMKQAMTEECFNGEQFKQMVDQVCQCAQKSAKGAQGAEEFCQRFQEDKEQQFPKNFFQQKMTAQMA